MSDKDERDERDDDATTPSVPPTDWRRVAGGLVGMVVGLGLIWAGLR